LVDKYLWNEEKQIYLDYDFVEEKQFECLSAAMFQPYFVGLADEKKIQGLYNCYAFLMKNYGVASTDRYYGKYQWSYPNAWAPNQYIAYVAFKNYGMDAYAEEVATKYMQLIERIYEQTGTTFEKYNVVDGRDDTYDEGDEHHTMMGWTTGVYMYFYENKTVN
jgi:alpha,alpha-trehalase